MGLSHLSFLRDWKNPADFPTVEPDEATVRADLQYHPDAIKDYINETLIPSHDALTSAKHSHDNKTVLDGITADDVAKWRGTIGTTYVKVDSTDDVISTVNGETYADIQALINAGKPVVVRFDDLDFYYSNTFGFSDSSGIHRWLYFRCVRGNVVCTLMLGDDNTWVFKETSLQPSSITDTGSYYTTDTVEGALQEIGAGLAGTYSKPSSGIPKTDLAEAVQTSLGKADTALQEHQSLAAYRTAAAQDAIDAQKQSIITDLETIRSGAAKGATALQSVPATYRTAAAQDAIDNTKLTDAPADGKEYARKNGSWHEITGTGTGTVKSVNGKTGAVTLNATEIPSTKFVPKDTVSFLIDGAFDEELVELKFNGTSASANDFISAVNSGATVTVSLHDQGNPKVTFEDMPVKYKITNDTLSLCFIAEAGHTYTPAIYVLSGPTSGTAVSDLVEHRFTDSLYQEHYVSANDLPVQAPLSVEEYLEELESNVDALQSKSITDRGGYFTSDTVEGALQEIGAELAGINTLLGSGIQISFTIDDGSEVNTFSVVSGTTFTEWIGTSRVISETSGLTLYVYNDGIVFADEAGVNALSLDGNTPVYGGDRIISGATYVAMNWGG